MKNRIVVNFAISICWTLIGFSCGNYAREGAFMWKCSDTTDLCEKSNKPIKDTIPDGYTSHEICRLTCGEYGNLWPKPTLKTRISKILVEFHPSSIKFECDITNEKYLKHLEKIKNIFLTDVSRECGNCSKKNENEVIIRIASQHVSTDLYFGIDESYVINTKQNDKQLHVNILSKTIYGARNALETLSQLIVSSRISPRQPAEEIMLVTINSATIGDRPTYMHRGLLLDTARNYLSITTIKRQIDAMAHSKMNVLHWHATDTQSFPLKLASVPILAKYGAYSEKNVYTEDDIRDLLAYAKYRGIRIILEIDGPAHAGNGWQWGPDAYLGKLAVCVNKKPWRNYCIQPPCGQLNPTNENLYDVLGQLYGDITKLFPIGEMFHMGGDEVFIPCWNASRTILKYMERNGKGRSTDDFLWLWARYQEKATTTYINKAKNTDSDMIIWSSALTNPEIIEKYLDSNRYIIQTWVGSDDTLPIELLNLGYRLIMSTKNAWYLDHGFWGSTPYYPWRDVYRNQLPAHKGVLGGEVCMWGELVDDSNIDSRVWPRAAAAAERLWSDPDDTPAEAEPRFYQHRNRLVDRGIKAEALAPTWCVQNEGNCY
ncbi:hypothetical protein Trydic_g16861 [Trypoxylus dichotomus]